MSELIQTRIVDVESLLRDYNKNSENVKLKSLYNSSTIFDILGKGRNETAHSSFLNWMLTSDEIHINTQHPLIGLLDTLTRRISQQYKPIESQFNERYPYDDISNISNALLARRLRIENVVGRVEVPVSEITTNNDIRKEIEKCSTTKKDSVDIFITCDVNGVDKIKKFEFIIENKIGAKEGGSKSKDNEYAKMTQTQRYYYACNKANNNGIYQFFVFLSPVSESDMGEYCKMDSKQRLCQSEHFICINYQDVYEDIIFPLLTSRQLLNREQYLIEEYVRTLSIPTIFKSSDIEDSEDKSKDNIDTSIILATSKEEKELLTNYWNNNQLLIIGALQAYAKIASEDEGHSDVDDWQRLIDQWGNLYTKIEYIQTVYDYLKRKWDSDPYFRKRLQYEHKIDDFQNKFSVQGSTEPFITITLNEEYNSEPIEVLGISRDLSNAQKTKFTNITGINNVPNKLEECNYQEIVINVFKKESDKVSCCNYFNSYLKTKNPGSGITDTINPDTHEVYTTHNNDKFDKIIDTCLELCKSWPDCPKAKILDFTLDSNKDVLNNFWHVNKPLIMASVRIMSESNNVSDETKKTIKKAYEELRSRDKSYYRVTLGENKDKELEGSKLAIYRWFAQTLLWKNSKPNITESNRILKKITGKSNLLSKDATNTSWTQLKRPKWCQHGEGESCVRLNTGNYTCIFPNILNYLNSQDAKTQGYTIEEIKRE